MVEGHGVEARSNQPYAQDPGMSLCESMYGPHVFVCVRARGVFQKQKQKKSYMILDTQLVPGLVVQDLRLIQAPYFLRLFGALFRGEVKLYFGLFVSWGIDK